MLLMVESVGSTWSWECMLRPRDAVCTYTGVNDTPSQGVFHEAVLWSYAWLYERFEYEVPDRMPKQNSDVLTKCDFIFNNLNYIMAKNILCIKTVCYNKNVNLHLHSSTLVGAIKNDWASHLAFHIKSFVKSCVTLRTALWNIPRSCFFWRAWHGHLLSWI